MRQILSSELSKGDALNYVMLYHTTSVEKHDEFTTADAQRGARHRFGVGLSVLCLEHCLELQWLLVSLQVGGAGDAA
jgi:hypothetical protein